MTDATKPCPFCGSTDLVVSDDHCGHAFRVACRACESSGPRHFLRADACAEWNKRATRCPVCTSTEEWVRERLRAGDWLAAVRTGMAYRMLLASFDDGTGAYFEECPPHIECHALGWLFAVRDELPVLADGLNHAIDMLTEFRNGHTLRASEFSPVMFAAVNALADREAK